MSASGEIIDLEKSAGKNDVKKVNERLERITKNWNGVKNLAKSVIKSNVVKDFLIRLNAPVYPHQIGVDRKMAFQAIMYAKEIRNRYTVLQLLYDLGELENFANIIVDEYYNN